MSHAWCAARSRHAEPPTSPKGVAMNNPFNLPSHDEVVAGIRRHSWWVYRGMFPPGPNPEIPPVTIVIEVDEDYVLDERGPRRPLRNTYLHWGNVTNDELNSDDTQDGFWRMTPDEWQRLVDAGQLVRISPEPADADEPDHRG
jgi:hypothetical protein